jgi:GLPGLI family protein
MIMKKSLSFFLSLFIIGFLISGCGSKANPKFISEGIIEYKASAVDPENTMAAIAPSKMIVRFKDNYTAAEMSAGAGLFGTSFISDPNKKQFINLVKMFGDKSAVRYDSDAVKKEVDADPKPNIEKLSDIKIIAGYTCNHARVSFPNSKDQGFDLWYTTEINIKNPNWTNPFHEIEGVLMEYQLKRYGLELRFKCTSVIKASIDDEVFQLPADYKIISPKEMGKKFEGF